MGFKGADGMFGDVAAVDIGGHDLVGGLPDVSDVATVLLDGFVVEDLVFDNMAALLEAGHDAGVCEDTVAILAGLGDFNEDDVSVAMVSDHELLVAAVGAEWEAACVVGVESSGVLDPEVDIFESVRQERFINCGGWQVKLIVACLGGADSLL